MSGNLGPIKKQAVLGLDCSNIISASLVSEQIVVYMYTNTTQKQCNTSEINGRENA